jgi:hypothetical protein
VRLAVASRVPRLRRGRTDRYRDPATRTRSPARRAALAAIIATLIALVSAASAVAGQYTMTFDAYDNQAPGCGAWAVNGLTTFGYDPPCSGEPLGFYGGGAMPAGARIGMQTNAPPGVAIIAALVDPYEIENINNNQGWGGGSYYAGGGNGWGSGAAVESDSGFSSSYWGFQMICGWSSCSNFGDIYLNSIQLTAEEDQGPALTAVGGGNLWYQASHWVWNPPGDLWSIALAGTDPSGVCQMWATLNGVQINSPGQTPDTAVWQQCPDWTWSASVDTRNYVPASGSLSLTLAGSNAAGVASAPAETLDVDNDPVQLSLSGPTTASTSSGTQYVTATASAGPSGVAIGCSLDGGPQRWQNGTVEQVPVGGAGDHVVSCAAHNGAVDPQGQYSYATPQSWSLDIGEPTVSAIGFAKIADALKCGRARERVTIPAHWATVRRHHQLVHVHKRAHTKTVSVERCHPRIVWQRRTVWVAVRRHGKLVSVKRTKRVRVPLIPHAVMQAKKRVAYGRGTAVSGWLGTASGVAIGGVPVEVVTAPNNGEGQFTAAAETTTAADGAWSAQLGPGPSRLVEAVYGGSASLLPVTSTPVEVNVPARITLSVSPHVVAWDGIVTLRGHLDGGYVPPDGVALRLLVRLPGRAQPYEPLPFRTDAQGNFVINWSWGTGAGIASYPLAVATTATESDFPFSASRSSWIRVTFGPPTPHHRHHHHRRRGAHKRSTSGRPHKRHRAQHRRKR